MATFYPSIAVASGLLILLAIPPAWKHKSWRRFFLAILLSFFGILLPLPVFWWSKYLVPEWKGGCTLGWVDCFHMGKIALTPFVIWATAALYAVEILGVRNRTRPWIVLGFLNGAIVSSMCALFGISLWLAERLGATTGVLGWLTALRELFISGLNGSVTWVIRESGKTDT